MRKEAPRSCPPAFQWNGYVQCHVIFHFILYSEKGDGMSPSSFPPPGLLSFTCETPDGTGKMSSLRYDMTIKLGNRGRRCPPHNSSGTAIAPISRSPLLTTPITALCGKAAGIPTSQMRRLSPYRERTQSGLGPKAPAASQSIHTAECCFRGERRHSLSRN